jgi:hypothetical protein
MTLFTQRVTHSKGKPGSGRAPRAIHSWQRRTLCCTSASGRDYQKCDRSPDKNDTYRDEKAGTPDSGFPVLRGCRLWSQLPTRRVFLTAARALPGKD